MNILVIPDTQVKEGTCIKHIIAAGKFAAETRPDVIVVIGDWWDMASLNRYGSRKDLEGLRVKKDLNAGWEAMLAFLEPITEFNSKRKYKKYHPRLIFCVGNHDPHVRLPRIYEEHPYLEGLFDIPQLEDLGFEVHDFLVPVEVAGIHFSHYFQNVHSARKTPIGGMMDTMIKNMGFSFVQGHTQGFKVAKHYLANKKERIGVLAGSFYSHVEDFMGLQGNEHWRGIVVLSNVKDGGADIAEISLKTLLQNYPEKQV